MRGLTFGKDSSGTGPRKSSNQPTALTRSATRQQPGSRAIVQRLGEIPPGARALLQATSSAMMVSRPATKHLKAVVSEEEVKSEVEVKVEVEVMSGVGKTTIGATSMVILRSKTP